MTKQPRDRNGRFVKVAGIELPVRDTVLLPIDLNLENLEGKQEGHFLTPSSLFGFEIEGLGHVFGGPYHKKPSFLRGIKLAPEIMADAYVVANIKDFGIPTNEDMMRLILWAVKILKEDGGVYVGCMMGQGRTGTFLACLVKCFDIPQPVKFVRENYNERAVETAEQYTFVEEFPVDVIKFLLRNI